MLLAKCRLKSDSSLLAVVWLVPRGNNYTMALGQATEENAVFPLKQQSASHSAGPMPIMALLPTHHHLLTPPTSQPCGHLPQLCRNPCLGISDSLTPSSLKSGASSGQHQHLYPS